MKKDICEKYCIGCGLCNSRVHLQVQESEKGYYIPRVETTEEEQFIETVCPVIGDKTGYLDGTKIWGRALSVLEGYSGNPDIRKRASSGGVLTALASFLVEVGWVDGVLHVSVDENNPTKTKAILSTTRQQIEDACGSRYCISHPWINIDNVIEKGKKYAAIGKPCDIAALRNAKDNLGIYSEIEYLLSFFCAGLPSVDANRNLLSQLGCEESECVSLTYRGNGWPGLTTAIDSEAREYTMEYSKAWGGILGRDIHPYCRLCIDGIGEAADVSCADGWFIKDGKVDFTESAGRNVIFSRTELGKDIVQQALKAGYVEAKEWDNIDDLQIIQKYQYTRRTTLKAKLLAYRVMGKSIPMYDSRILKQYAKLTQPKEKIRIFLGTIKRIVQKKI